MNEITVKRLRTVVPTIVLFLLIILLVGAAFIPSVRGKSSVTASYSYESDPEAIRALNGARAFAAANDYRTEMSGSVKARVLGIPYSQKITGKRTVNGDGNTDTAESVSAFVKAAIKREHNEKGYFVTRGVYKNKSFTYGTPKIMERNEYIAAYGKPFTDIVKYDLDNTVISAKCVGSNTYKFVLDPSRSTEYTRNEVKTTLGGKSYPKYEHVEFTLITDGEKAVKVTTHEKFEVDKFGGTSCTAEYTEKFIYE